jgi:flagellar biosynthesis chaperone FliJ
LEKKRRQKEEALLELEVVELPPVPETVILTPSKPPKKTMARAEDLLRQIDQDPQPVAMEKSKNIPQVDDSIFTPPTVSPPKKELTENLPQNMPELDMDELPEMPLPTAADAAEAKQKVTAKEAAESVKEAFEETFDFFDRRVKVLSDALSLLETNMENVTGAFAKNNLIDAQIGINAEKVNNYTDAMAMYTQKANEALSKLPSDIQSKIKDGAVDLTTFIGDGNEEVVEAINEYSQWADKVADCKQELAGLKEAIRDLELEKFNNIMQDFTDQFDLREGSKDLIDKQIALFKEAGQLIGESFFNAKIDQTKKQLAILEEEKNKLAEQMTSAVTSGRVKLCPAV